MVRVSDLHPRRCADPRKRSHIIDNSILSERLRRTSPDFALMACRPTMFSCSSFIPHVRTPSRLSARTVIVVIGQREGQTGKNGNSLRPPTVHPKIHG